MRTERMGNMELHDHVKAVGTAFYAAMAAVGAAWGNAPILLQLWVYVGFAHLLVMQLWYWLGNSRAKFSFKKFTKSLLTYAVTGIVLMVMLIMQKKLALQLPLFDLAAGGFLGRELIGLFRVAAKCGVVVDPKLLAALDALPGFTQDEEEKKP